MGKLGDNTRWSHKAVGLVTCLILCVLSLFFSSYPAYSEQPIPASQFTNSVGINTHLHYGPLYTDNFPLILQRLRELGVQHIRNGLQATKKPEFYNRVKAVNDAGIKVLWILSTDQPSDLVLSYLSRFPNGNDGFEAPNEFDASKQSDWAPLMKQYMSGVYPLFKRDSKNSLLSIVGPSLTNSKSYLILGNQSAYMDVANLHNYPGGHNPGTPGWGAPDAHGAHYGSIAWNLNLGKDVWGGKPVWTTEYGYTNSPAAKDGVPEDVAAIYLPRALLEQYLQGIRRTYVFELLAGHPENDGAYGLLRGDGSPKPAFTTISNLLRLLRDDTSDIAVSDVDFSLEGSTTDVHHLLLQKSDSSYYLLFWIEKPGYDVDTHKKISVPQQAISVHFEQPVANVTSYRLNTYAALAQTQEHLNNQSVSLSVSDSVLALHFTREPAPPGHLSVRPK
jgi:hypothetical protein